MFVSIRPAQLISQLLTHVDGTGEGAGLSQDGETVAQVSHVVLGLHFVSVERFVTLKNDNRTVIY